VVRIQPFRTLMWRVHLPGVTREPSGMYLTMHLDEKTETAILFDGDQRVLPI
jgi:hypothetical protein